MALIRTGGQASAQATGAVLTLKNVTISPSGHVIDGLVDLSTNNGSVRNAIFSDTSALTVGNYSVHHSGTGTTWDEYLVTTVACDVYKDGNKIGTTTPNTDFGLGFNILTQDLGAVYVIIPV